MEALGTYYEIEFRFMSSDQWDYWFSNQLFNPWNYGTYIVFDHKKRYYKPTFGPLDEPGKKAHYISTDGKDIHVGVVQQPIVESVSDFFKKVKDVRAFILIDADEETREKISARDIYDVVGRLSDIKKSYRLD